MKEVFIVISGEFYSDTKIEAIYEYEWQAGIHVENAVIEYNRNYVVNINKLSPVDINSILKPEPVVKKANKDNTTAYWQSNTDFIRIDKWEVQ